MISIDPLLAGPHHLSDLATAKPETGRLRSVEADLRRRIASERALRRIKPPFKRTLFARISGLVRKYGLEGKFLEKLDAPPADLFWKSLRLNSLKKKGRFEPPLFSLCTEDEYRVTMAIIAGIDNPYLYFAHAPDELLVCRSLFSLNSGLEPERLAHYHFETLLLYEMAVERTNGLILELDVIARQMTALEHNAESVLNHLAQKIGFAYSSVDAVYIKNLREKINRDCEEGMVSDYGISPDDIWGETLVEKYSIGIRVAMNILGRNLHAIRESYKEELLEEGRLQLDSVRKHIAEVHRFIAAVKSMEP